MLGSVESTESAPATSILRFEDHPLARKKHTSEWKPGVGARCRRVVGWKPEGGQRVQQPFYFGTDLEAKGRSTGSGKSGPLSEVPEIAKLVKKGVATVYRLLGRQRVEPRR